MPKLLWFRQDRDETAILDTLAAMAAQHGYTNRAGPKHGAGNVAELMAAIATGEVKLLLLPDEQQTLAAEFLRQSAADCAANVPLADALTAIADSMRDADVRRLAFSAIRGMIGACVVTLAAAPL